MKSSKLIAAATAASIVALSTVSPAFAWHPEGKIQKEVQNVTASSAYADANTAATAIKAKPGDTLKYRITVSNPAKPASNEWNDLHKVVIADTLPSGVTLQSGSKDKNYTVIYPGKSETYEFTVKVNASVKDKDLICNEAKFTGNSKVNDAPRSGKDQACVVVDVPKVTPPTPETPKQPEKPAGQGEGQILATTLPAVIPATGAESLLGLGTALSAAAYVVTARLQRRK